MTGVNECLTCGELVPVGCCTCGPRQVLQPNEVVARRLLVIIANAVYDAALEYGNKEAASAAYLAVFEACRTWNDD